ncbi:MAG: type II toxin-antitoxin system HicB family antitoxin [Patescibacteria group bacterium]|nr:type II toxin-antitoxin system HicB family antitoxin [Patescibacteria group bacterium]
MKAQTKSALEYKGYIGSVEVDMEARVLVGRLLYIKDTIGYSGESLDSIEAAFRDAVDDYLDACAEAGEEPDVPCKGTFNVRVGPARHREANLDASRRGIGLNEWVCMAFDAFISASQSVTHHHEHHHMVEVGVKVLERGLVASQSLEWINEDFKGTLPAIEQGSARNCH